MLDLRHLLPIASMVLFAACGTDPAPPAVVPAQDTAQTPAENTVVLTPLTGSGLRYDGVYVHVDGRLHYYMRFFERGNVALVAGPEEETDTTSIRKLLTQDVQSGWNNVHNTPVERRNDSLFFRTMSVRGAIDYSGVLRGDTIHMLKVSGINGRRVLIPYVFEMDRL